MRNFTRFAMVVLCVLLLLPSLANAEMTRERKNLVGGEVLGRGIFLTVNYERYLTDIVSLGAGIFGVGSDEGGIAIIPVHAAATLGFPHSLYVSGGITIFAGTEWDGVGTDDDSTAASTPVFQVAYQYNAESGLYIRPSISFMSELGIAWPGFAIGGSF